MIKQRKISAWFCAILLLFAVFAAGILTVNTVNAEPLDDPPAEETTDPVDPYPVDPNPVDPDPVDPDPVDPDPVDPDPVDPDPVDPDPVDPNPVDPNPVDPTPYDPTPTNPAGQAEQTAQTNQTNRNRVNTAPAASPQDVLLNTLGVSCGKLFPDFSPDIHEYTVYASKDQIGTDVNVTAAAVNANASLKISGPSALAEKDIEKTVTISLANQSAEYRIQIHVLKPTELLLADSLYAIPQTLDLKSLPMGFEKTKVTFSDGTAIRAAKSRDGDLLLTQFVNDAGSELWYCIDLKKQSFEPVQLTKKDGKLFVVVSTTSDLLYGGDDEENGYYLYNSETDTLSFCINPTETATPSRFKNANAMPAMTVTAFSVAAICLLTCAVILAKYLKWKNENAGQTRYFRPYIALPDDEKE